MLQDSYNRRFEYLRLSITDVCNFRCTYCLPEGYRGEGMRGQLSRDEIANLVRAFAAEGTRKIRLTGGEPTLRRDFCEIVRVCRQTPGIEQVALTTNGHRLGQHVAAWIDAGITGLNVSLDSLGPESFRQITGRNELRATLAGIDQALTLGLPVKVNTVLMRAHAADELEQYLQWLKTTPVTLRFIELMQTGDNHTLFAQQHVRGQSIIEALQAKGWQLQSRQALDGPAQILSHPDFAGRVGFILPYSPDFCLGCNRLRVTSRGKLQLCLFGEEGLDLRPWLQDAAQLPLLREQMRRSLADKPQAHRLHQAISGPTHNLAMYGG